MLSRGQMVRPHHYHYSHFRVPYLLPISICPPLASVSLSPSTAHHAMPTLLMMIRSGGIIDTQMRARSVIYGDHMQRRRSAEMKLCFSHFHMTFGRSLRSAATYAMLSVKTDIAAVRPLSPPLNSREDNKCLPFQ